MKKSSGLINNRASRHKCHWSWAARPFFEMAVDASTDRRSCSKIVRTETFVIINSVPVVCINGSNVVVLFAADICPRHQSYCGSLCGNLFISMNAALGKWFALDSIIIFCYLQPFTVNFDAPSSAWFRRSAILIFTTRSSWTFYLRYGTWCNHLWDILLVSTETSIDWRLPPIWITASLVSAMGRSQN